jgi:hypothetical protein
MELFGACVGLLECLALQDTPCQALLESRLLVNAACWALDWHLHHLQQRQRGGAEATRLCLRAVRFMFSMCAKQGTAAVQHLAFSGESPPSPRLLARVILVLEAEVAWLADCGGARPDVMGEAGRRSEA